MAVPNDLTVVADMGIEFSDIEFQVSILPPASVYSFSSSESQMVSILSTELCRCSA